MIVDKDIGSFWEKRGHLIVVIVVELIILVGCVLKPYARSTVAVQQRDEELRDGFLALKTKKRAAAAATTNCCCIGWAGFQRWLGTSRHGVLVLTHIPALALVPVWFHVPFYRDIKDAWPLFRK